MTWIYENRWGGYGQLVVGFGCWRIWKIDHGPPEASGTKCELRVGTRVCERLSQSQKIIGKEQEKLAGITVTVRYCSRHWRIKIEADEKK